MRIGGPQDLRLRRVGAMLVRGALAGGVLDQPQRAVDRIAERERAAVRLVGAMQPSVEPVDLGARSAVRKRACTRHLVGAQPLSFSLSRPKPKR